MKESYSKRLTFKNLFLMMILLVSFTVLNGSVALAQTYYVNNLTGSDGFNGLSPTPLGNGVDGPKLTLGAAVAAVPGGNTITVQFTGVNYTEGPNIIINKQLTLNSVGGEVIFANADLTVDIAAGINITGPFRFQNLTLQNGLVTGAGNLKVNGTTVTRTNGSVDTQILFSGPPNKTFIYNGGQTMPNPVVAGGELPATTDPTNFGNLTTVGTDLRLSKNNQMNGLLTLGGVLDLVSFTLTVNGNNLLHTHTGNILGGATGGTLNFVMNGNTTLTGPGNLPNITASGTGILNLSGSMTNVHTLSASGSADIITNSITTVNTAGNTSNVITNSGNGTITLSNVVTVHGNVLLNHAGLGAFPNGNRILFQAGAPITVNGNVTNQSQISANLSNSGGANIIFPDQIITITGEVYNNTRFSGTSVANSNTGNILFGSTSNDVSISGLVRNNAQISGTPGAGSSSFTDNGCILFATTTGDISIPAGVQNSSNFSAFSNGARNGNISFSSYIPFGGFNNRVAGSQIGTPTNRVGPVINSSVRGGANFSGDIVFGGSGLSDGFYGTSVSVSGTALGGRVLFGNELFDVTGNVQSTRTGTGATSLIIGTGAGTAVTTTISGTLTNTGTQTIELRLTGATIINAVNTGSGTTTNVVNLSTNSLTVNTNATIGGTFNANAMTTGNFIIGAPTGNLSVTGTLTLTGLTSGNISINGALSNSGTINSSISSGNFSVASSVTNSGTITLNGLNTGNFNVIGSVTNSGTISLNALTSGNFTVNGPFTHTAGTLTIGSATYAGAILFGSTVSVSGGTVNFNNQGGSFTVNGLFTQTGGTVNFNNIVSGTILFGGGYNISNGTVNVAATHTQDINMNGDFTVSGGTVNFLCAGVPPTGLFVNVNNKTINWTAGTLNFGNRERVNVTGKGVPEHVIGGTNTNPTFVSPVTELRFGTPTPVEIQNIRIGNFNPIYPGPFSIVNTSDLPNEVTRIKGGNLIVRNNVTFEAQALIPNTQFNRIVLDEARIYIGDKNNLTPFGGNFFNITGYRSAGPPEKRGRVVMYGGTGFNQTVTPGVPTTEFGDFEVDNGNSGSPNVTIAGPNNAVFTGFFYLSDGNVQFNNIVFDSTSNSPGTYPTIVRSEGQFVGGFPTVVDMVNVVMIGLDKVTSFEIPPSTNKLFNLEIATTNSGQTGSNFRAGFGIVQLGANTAVNGTLTIRENQSLYTDGFNLELRGSSAVINGYLVDDGNTRVFFNRPTGTAITGNGYLPSFQVNAGSVGNTIATTFQGLVSQGLGPNGLWDGPIFEPFLPGSGNITFAGGATSNLTAGFISQTIPTNNVPPNGHINDLTLAAGATFNLSTNVILKGNLNLPNGNVVIGGFILYHYGANTNISTPATLTSTTAGLFDIRSTAGIHSLISTGATLIDANVRYRSDNDINYSGTGNLTIRKNFELIRHTTTPGTTNFDIANGLTLNLEGVNVTVATNTAVTTPNTGILLLDIHPVHSPDTIQVVSLPTAFSVANLTILDDVTLSGTIVGSTLTVTTSAIHTGGLLTLGNNTNFQIGNGTAATFTRNGPTTYSGTGYFIWNSITPTGFNQASISGVGNMVINNFRVNQPLISQTANANLVIVENLDLNSGSITIQSTPNHAGTFRIGIAGNSVVPKVFINNASDVFTNPLVYDHANVDFVFTGATNYAASHTRIWPGTAGLVRDVTINKPSGGTVILTGANRTISRDLYLLDGNLNVNSNNLNMPTVGSKIQRWVNGSVFQSGTGTFTAANVNLEYRVPSGPPATIISGDEYQRPTIVNDVQIGPQSGTTVNFVFARTIAGTLTMNSTLNINANTTFSLVQTIPNGSTINVAPSITANWNGGLNIANGANYNTAANSITNVAGNITNNGTVSMLGQLIVTGNLTNGGTITTGGPINITGNFINNGNTNIATSLSVSGNISGSGNLALQNNASLSLNTASITGGTLTLNDNNTVNLNGNVTINNLLVNSATAFRSTLNVFGNLIVTGTANFVNPNNINMNFYGSSVQNVNLGGPINISVYDLSLLKSSDSTVVVSAGNITIGNLLVLTRGVLQVDPPANVTITLAVNSGGFITSLGYLRNPSSTSHFAHVFGNLGAFIPAGTRGRVELPIGTQTAYRPVAVTFRNESPLIVPTTLRARAVNSYPYGNVGFPIYQIPGNDLTRIDTTSTFGWQFSATPGLGSQIFDLELEGRGFNPADYPNGTVDDLRVVSRLGEVATNTWVLQQGQYSNFEATVGGVNYPIARIFFSQANLISQGATFALGFKKLLPPTNIYSVSGTVEYPNISQPVQTVKNVNVTLSGNTVTTGVNGVYSFSNLNNGTYPITTSTTNPWLVGAVNATDAQWVSQYFNGTRVFNPVQMLAADVNLSSSINNTDALLIVRRWAGLPVVNWTAPDWVFVNPTATINNANVTGLVIPALITGDVNGSANLSLLPKQKSISVDASSLAKAMVNEEFVIPISLNQDAKLGAVSIKFTYPTNLATFEGITSSFENMVVNDVDGEVRIAWADLNGNAPLLAKADQSIIGLRFKPTSEFTVNSKFAIELDENLTELSDINGEVITPVMKVPTIIMTVPEEFALLQNYPNPFNPSTNIKYNLKEKGLVTLEVYNALGQVVSTLVNEVQDAGRYTVNFTADNLASGIYFYKLSVDSGSEKFVKINKMMLIK